MFNWLNNVDNYKRYFDDLQEYFIKAINALRSQFIGR